MRAIEITDALARLHADLWAQVAAPARLIGAHDLWIAAIALAHAKGVATANAGEFERVPGLRVVTAPS